jgi:acyl dehydratase
METVDAEGAPVSTTDYGSIFRGVGCGAGRRVDEPWPPPDLPAAAEAAWRDAVAIGPELAHTYTECARIWNPIHTDRAVAVGAGLAGIILHGTATLALAVSRARRRAAAGGAEPRRIVARFTGMVPLPSTVTVEGMGTARAAEGTWTGFRACGADGSVVLRDAGILMTAPAT